MGISDKQHKHTQGQKTTFVFDENIAQKKQKNLINKHSLILNTEEQEDEFTKITG